MHVKILNDTMLEGVILEGKPSLVAFMGACSIPCNHFGPEFDSAQVPVSKYAINIDENPDIAARLSVDSVPTTLLLRDGKEVARWTGPYSREALEERVLEQMRQT